MMFTRRRQPTRNHQPIFPGNSHTFSLAAAGPRGDERALVYSISIPSFCFFRFFSAPFIREGKRFSLSLSRRGRRQQAWLAPPQKSTPEGALITLPGRKKRRQIMSGDGRSLVLGSYCCRRERTSRSVPETWIRTQLRTPPTIGRGVATARAEEPSLPLC